ncbi:MAG: hypothetical protein JXQ93_12825 [Flavobacteriaceae bacterium]
MNILKAFYVYALISSLIAIWNSLNDLTNITVFVGLLGVVSSILFFLKQYKFYYLAIIWIIIQIPFVIVDDITIDLSQFLNVHLSLNIGDVSLGVNAQVFLLFLLKYLYLSKYLNQNIMVKPFTESAKKILNKPLVFLVNDLTEGKRLSGQIDFKINDESYSKALFQPMKDERVNKGAIVLIPSNSNSKTPVKFMVTYEVGEN